jgi:hypothetical protein
MTREELLQLREEADREYHEEAIELSRLLGRTNRKRRQFYHYLLRQDRKKNISGAELARRALADGSFNLKTGS